MIDDGKTIEVNCHFCERTMDFNPMTWRDTDKDRKGAEKNKRANPYALAPIVIIEIRYNLLQLYQ